MLRIVDMIAVTLLGIFVVYTTFLYLAKKYKPALWNRKTIPVTSTDRALFVIAHPDDECMFFGPTLVTLVQQLKEKVYILCLSPGDFEGKGKERKTELWQSCCSLGVDPSSITLLKYDELKDGSNVNWNVDLISRIVEGHVISHKITTVITFDGYGISGHKNHIAIYDAMINLIRRQLLPGNVKVYVLESVSIFRKYGLFLLDIAISYNQSQYMYLVTISQQKRVSAAMRLHASQLTWYRRLYITYSRYIPINTLRQILPNSAPPYAFPRLRALPAYDENKDAEDAADRCEVSGDAEKNEPAQEQVEVQEAEKVKED